MKRFQVSEKVAKHGGGGGLFLIGRTAGLTVNYAPIDVSVGKQIVTESVTSGDPRVTRL